MLWRRFFRLAAGSAALFTAMIYGFVIVVDPWGSLPLTVPLDRAPVSGNQRFAYPALARSPRFDSAIFGSSTSRLLRPDALDSAFGAHFANLAMNDATPYEISRLLQVFSHAHPSAKLIVIGLEERWCVTGDTYKQFTPRPFPAWMYRPNRWPGYAQMFNLYAVQESAKEFGVLTGLKQEEMGRDGYTRFVPPDSEYDPVRAAAHLREAGPDIPSGEHAGPPEEWRFPALELLRDDLAALSAAARKILFFVPYYHRMLPVPGSDGARLWDECKRRVAALAHATPDSMAVDFMLPTSITEVDGNYWDPLHYRVSVADRLARHLTAADRGEASADYRILSVGSAR